MYTRFRRGVVALTTVMACLVIMATPAAAAEVTLHWKPVKGKLTLHNSTSTATDDIDFSDGTGTGCGGGGIADINSAVTTINDSSVTSVNRFQLGTSHYIAEITRLASTSSTLSNITTTSADFSSGTLTLRMDVYVATNTSSTATDCAHGTTRLCRLTLTLHLSGEYEGDVADPKLSDKKTGQAPAASLTVTPPCGSPMSTYIGGTASASEMEYHFCSVVLSPNTATSCMPS